MGHDKRKIIVAGNWKMHHRVAETEIFFQGMLQGWEKLPASTKESIREQKLELIVFPSFSSLGAAVLKSELVPVSVGAQNAHWEKKGAFTGEISGPMLEELQVKWVLVGHSERRQYFGETDETVHKRAFGLLEQGFHVMVCVGETREERESGQTEEVLTRQIRAAFPDGNPIDEYLDGRVSIAYESVWAIGTGLTATTEQAEKAHAFIRKDLQDRFGKNAADKTTILYGGSVKPENFQELLECPNVDGGLIGGASLESQSFLSLTDTAGRFLSKK